MILYPLPGGPFLGVYQFNAPGLQLIPDAVGLGEVLGFLGLVPLEHQRVHRAVTSDPPTAEGVDYLITIREDEDEVED